MDRRSFVKGAALSGAAVGASALATPAVAEGKRELKMVTTWPKNFPGLGTGAQRTADMITAATDGRITVKLFAAGELVPPFESFDAVSQGTADMYHGAEYYWQGKHKAFNFFTSVPLGLTANEFRAWINFGGGQELWDELSGQFNIKALGAGNTGVQMGGWFRKEINTVEDLKGLKMRMPGLGGEVLRRLGGAAVALPGGEIFQALQSGTIDATEWVGPWNDLAFGFHKIAKFYYWPGFHEPGSELAVGFNKDIWESFTPADQALIKACCDSSSLQMYSEYNAKNGAALDELISKHDVKLRKFSDEIFQAFADKSNEVIDEVATTDELSQRIVDSFKKSRSEIGAWGAIAEQGYVEARTKALNKS